MSPLWIEHCAWLTRHHALLASQGWPAGGSGVRRQRAAIDNNADTAVMRLQQLLADAPRSAFKQDRLQLLLGGSWARYAVLPWQDNLFNDNDWRGYAAVVFAKQYAVPVENWRIRVAPGPFGQPRLAAAVDEGFYQTLAELARSSRLKLAGVTPLLTSAINLHQRKLKGKEFAFLLLEADHATCAFHHGHAWRGVVTLPNTMSGEAEAYALAALVRDAAMLAGQALPDQVYVASSELGMLSGEAGDFDAQWLGGVHAHFGHRSEWQGATA
ncbi:hypothetical protein [Chitinolyticbacter meiyuanensis]|uniref:hypothetical protein n=1 Tax=Chitinolyticbacter meiyuanensis TaxID=682798 RepID=UPI0011E59DC0|nr:hypothetical protein [Chitinolyticbacter meiyuanensis]